MYRTAMPLSAFLIVCGLATVHCWGGLFNRFSSDMLANLGYGRGPYRHYAYGQDVPPEEAYAEALEGNRIDDVLDEPAHCYSAPCSTNGECCRGLMCLETEDGGRCLPAFAGRKLGEICNRENQCEAGLVCEEVVPGEMHVCRPPTSGRKQYNEDCNASSECDITRGLCCVMQRRHRQKARKSCGYFKEPLVCIGPVATDQIREFVQHTAGEKRIGVYRLH
ncbi:ITG-like peptide [Cydia amplana]|uniref:ITG-like peptide n=1 Tax=Cydia amplana TaxID=1869771 RepID=UPI002FE67E39